MSKSEPALVLYYHPFASYCQKVLAALYESGTPFHPHLVDLGDEAARNAFYAIWPIGKFPVLRDASRGVTIPESTTIIEYLDLHHPGAARLLPADAEDAWRVRARDRFFDSYIHEPMQKIVGDRLRPPESKDATGVDSARKPWRPPMACWSRNWRRQPGPARTGSIWRIARQRLRFSTPTGCSRFATRIRAWPAISSACWRARRSRGSSRRRRPYRGLFPKGAGDLG